MTDNLALRVSRRSAPFPVGNDATHLAWLQRAGVSASHPPNVRLLPRCVQTVKWPFASGKHTTYRRSCARRGAMDP